MAIELGDDIVWTLKWRKRSDRTLVEPTTIRCEVQPPNSQAKDTINKGDAELSKIADGHYELTTATDRDDLDDVGRWDLTVTSTGTGKGAQSGFAMVQGPRVSPPG